MRVCAQHARALTTTLMLARSRPHLSAPAHPSAHAHAWRRTPKHAPKKSVADVSMCNVSSGEINGRGQM
eukprot:718070-Alexandrium_andersonii.AAC.1